MAHLQPTDILSELPPVRRYARSLTRDDSAADDVVQEALLRALEKRNTFQPGGSVRVWLLAIVHNIFVSTQRRARAEERGNARFAESMIDHLDPDQEHSAYLQEVAEAFARLPDPQRAILHLVAVEGQSYQEAAAILGIPIGTVMSRLSRARMALRRAQTRDADRKDKLRVIGGRDAG